jgi:hypothetical protein
MIAQGRLSLSSDELYKRISGEDILRKYVGVEYIPSLIHSPLRNDEHRSFSLFYGNSGDVLFKDHASGLAGDALTLLSLMWDCTREEAISRIWKDCDCSSREPVPAHRKPIIPTDIQFKMRKPEQHDVDYWKSYGITPAWLKFAEIVPISHFVVIRGSQSAIFKADKYAYIFYAKDGVKLYQPYSNMKWLSSQKKDTVQLYRKLPPNGDIVCVCSSMKDALCLWANAGIPSIAPQSEGTALPFVIVEDLKRRFKHCYILYDNDSAGIGYAREAAKETGFTNIVLPQFEGGKDVSDLFKSLDNKNDFQKIKQLFNGEHN